MFLEGRFICHASASPSPPASVPSTSMPTCRLVFHVSWGPIVIVKVIPCSSNAHGCDDEMTVAREYVSRRYVRRSAPSLTCLA